MKKGLISLLKGKVSMKVYELQAQKFMNFIQTGVNNNSHMLIGYW